MAVLPGWQRQGIGSLLVREGLNNCQRIGIEWVAVMGHPNYYPRFGFVPASQWEIPCAYEVPEEAFMALELRPGALRDIAGTVHYEPEFDGA